MSRQEHLEWCKRRSREEKGAANKWASFHSDMMKHEELKNHIALSLGMVELMTGASVTRIENFIEGFN